MAVRNVNTSNRGKWLEDAITACNRMYSLKGVAQIDKIATPMKPKSRSGQVIGAKYTEKSTVDFVGTLKGGRSIAFDTKQCKAPRMPLTNIKQHQIDYLTKVHELGGEAFLLILFTTENELYKLDISQLNVLGKELTRQSIPLQWFRDNLEPIRSGNGVIYDYLEGLVD
ncbi:Holliday junction resolvase RecU [Macrococcus bovicus]|uniref:Holliday junction resolvase RecU n=1 Tax=Macrococcus bovicus TaxID=69968 RepID=UPI0025A590F4|nr:Holliday junction resolvase RecU [Macrococcus bovicus]WJP97083.1 Holliday junction resolvase RecU [Macrococcus bovicus]